MSQDAIHGPKITSVEIHAMEREVRDMGNSPYNARYQPGTRHAIKGFALRINSDAGVSGEFVSTHGVEAALIEDVAGLLVGRDALDRESIYYQLRRFLQQVAWIGLGPIDIALWDLAGKYFNKPIYKLLGAYRDRVPTYLSTARGETVKGGLDSPEAFADYAEECLKVGLKGYKIHPWMFGDAPIERQIELIRTVADRVGGKMDLMLDPASEYETLGEAAKVGWACDEAKFFWIEDMYKDGGVAQFGLKKLRELVKTPLLQPEHSRGVEQRMNYLLSGATDFLREDVLQDGITSTMKLAHAAEALGADIEIHVGGAETIQCLGAIRNSNYYELGTIHPHRARREDPLYLPDSPYKGKSLDYVGKDGCVEVPQGPGLGVLYDWKYIESMTTGTQVFN